MRGYRVELILTLLTGPKTGHMLRVKGTRMIIGRGHGCKIRIPSGSVSRSHSLINWQAADGGYFMIEDMGSTNGTFINAIQVLNPVVLLPGDDLSVGSIGFRVHYTMKPRNLKSLAEARASSGYPPPGAPPLATVAVAVPDDVGETDPGLAQTSDHEIPLAQVMDDQPAFEMQVFDQESDYVVVEDLDHLAPIREPEPPKPVATPLPKAPPVSKVPPASKSPSVPKPPPGPTAIRPAASAPPPPPAPLVPVSQGEPDFGDLDMIPLKDDFDGLDLNALDMEAPIPGAPPVIDPDAGPSSSIFDPMNMSSSDLVLPRDMHMAELARLLQEDSKPSIDQPPPKKKK